MISKEKLNETLTHFPERFNIDELILIDKIDKGNWQSENNETITGEEFEVEMQKWKM
jgi:hypothetical protein